MKIKGKKTLSEGILEIENLGKRTGKKETNINNRVQEIGEKTYEIEDKIEKMDTSVKENDNLTNS